MALATVRADRRPAYTAGRRVRRHWWTTPWLFLAFALVVNIAFVIYPFVNTILLAFTDASLLRPGKFNGLDNFSEMLADDRFWTAMLNSTLYVLIVVPIMVIAPLLLACLVNVKLPLVGFFRTAYYLPVVASAVAVGIMWSWMLDSRGLINQTFAALHWLTKPIPFLGDRWLLLLSAMAITVWTGLGYYMVIYLAALANVPSDLYDAASMDGAGAWRKFWSVTVPGVRTTMTLVSALSAVAAFRVFSEVYVLTKGTGGPGGEDVTMIMLIQREGTGLAARVGYSSALSLVCFVITIGLMIVVLRMQRQESSE